MTNSFGTDVLIQAQNPKSAASWYAEHLGFEVTGETPQMVSLHGQHINLFIERGPALGAGPGSHCWQCRRSQTAAGEGRLRNHQG
jgi:hypothetical protein